VIEHISPLWVMIQDATVTRNQLHEVGSLIEVRKFERLYYVANFRIPIVVYVPTFEVIVKENLSQFRVGQRLRACLG